MRYLILLHGDEAAEAELSADERRRIVEGHIEFSRRARERGYHLSGDALEPSATAISIRKGQVTDGPFAETKEEVGGYYIVECGGREEVIELARGIPDSPGLVIDIRQLSDMWRSGEAAHPVSSTRDAGRGHLPAGSPAPIPI